MFSGPSLLYSKNLGLNPCDKGISIAAALAISRNMASNEGSKI